MASKSLPARVGCMRLSTCATASNAASNPDKALAASASALIAMSVPSPIRSRDSQPTDSNVCSTVHQTPYDMVSFVI
jgi:hypothetical protein